MKKIILLLSLVFYAGNAQSEPNYALLPFGFGVGIPMMPLFSYSKRIEKVRDQKIYNISKINFDICDLEDSFYINANKQNIFIGQEKLGYSNINKVKEIEPLFNLKKQNSIEYYMCINPKKTSIFEHGCLDTLEKDSIQKINGRWVVSKLFSYDYINYIQLKQYDSNKKFTTATTELKAIENIIQSRESSSIADCLKP